MIKIPVRVSGDICSLPAFAMAASVRKHMEADLIHVAESGTEKLEGFDSFLAVDHNNDYVEQLVKMLSMIDGDVLSLDYDILLNADVSDVFDDGFDVCVTSRPESQIRKYGLSQSYNLGVVFSRNPQFWREVYDIYMQQPLRDGWMKSQTLVSLIIDHLSDKYKVSKIPGEIYNYSPDSENESFEGKKIIHYKGKRKIWMVPESQREAVAHNVSKVVGLIKQKKPDAGDRAET